jgi:acyl-CoA synthetase (AMP-forming)/AMP-acid ligase II
MWINCSEPIRAESHAMFLERFGPFGVKPGSLATCYAMAETTFAVTQSSPGEDPPAAAADRAELARGRYSPADGTDPRQVRRCVSSGQPIPGCEVQAVGPNGTPLPDGGVGELLIRSESIFDGYRNQPAKTAEAFVDGWYRSGDLGFILDDHVFVIGRKKDVIIVAGKNLAPEDIEDAVGGVPGVLPGRVVAFGVDKAETGTEEIHVIAETEAADLKLRRELTFAVQRAGMGVDVTIARVHLVPPRWLIKSTSGKISRSANRERLDELRAAA